MPHSSRARVKEPNPELGIENAKPLEQRPARQRTVRDSVGLVKSTRSSLPRGTSTSRSLRASSIESYIDSPSSSRSRSIARKLNDSKPTGQKVDNPTITPESSDRPGLLNPEAQPENSGIGTSSETSRSAQSHKGTTNRVTMSVGRLPPFVRGKLNKAECGPTSCGIRQTVIVQLHQVGVPKEKKYSLAEATEIFLHNIWRDKALQITALSNGMHTHLKYIIEEDPVLAAKEYPSLLDVLMGDLERI